MRCCCYPNCKRDKNQIRSLFKVPKNSERRNEWRLAMGYTSLCNNNYVCELHFKEDDILRSYKTLMPDGSYNIIEKARPRLSPTSVPIKIVGNISTKKIGGKTSDISETSSVISTTNDVSIMDSQNNESESIPLLELFPSEDMNVPPLIALSPSFKCLDLRNLQRQICDQLPTEWTSFIICNQLTILNMSEKSENIKSLIIHEDTTTELYIANKKMVNISGLVNVESLSDILKNIKEISPLLLCQGIGDSKGYSTSCATYITLTSRNRRCKQCAIDKHKILLREKLNGHKLTLLKQKLMDKTRALKVANQRIKRLISKMSEMKKKISIMHHQFLERDNDLIEKKIKNLCKEQQDIVRTYFLAAETPKNGIRYTKQWIYECLLMRIKSRKLYEHLRNHNILPLPHINTIRKYIEKISSSYGFHDSVFRSMKEKAIELPQEERRGAILIDEMKLMENTSFDRKTMQFKGLVDLGDYTPEHQKNERGDHALVIMFQPFRGQWVQTLGCFLSKGCAPSNVLCCLILECLTLLEQSSFFCDVLTTDGAQWNRSMWTKFGVDEHNISCQHPCDPERKLWFCSDFPHLVKNFRNFIVANDETFTPDGIIKKRHWVALLDIEHQDTFGLKISYKLTADHLQPKFYQKMNVPMAFELFSDRVSAAMLIFKDINDALCDSEPTVKFINRVNKVIKAMMSRSAINALRLHSSEYQTLSDFLDYLQKWEDLAVQNNYKFLTKNNVTGLKVTLKAALEIVTFLNFEHNYLYLMTTRLNQDALERFFGLARGVCGSNDHPDSTLFGYMFNLMSSYSLLKPCKGSNICGGDRLTALLTAVNNSKTSKAHEEYTLILDDIIENKTYMADVRNPLIDEVNNNTQWSTNYNDTSKYILSYMAGYIVRKSKRWTKCGECMGSLQEISEFEKKKLDENKLINLLSKGLLKHPSKTLCLLLQKVEKNIMEVILKNNKIEADTFFHILYSLQETEIPKVGCSIHLDNLTRKILNFYLIMRANFLSKGENKKANKAKEQTKKSRKMAKL